MADENESGETATEARAGKNDSSTTNDQDASSPTVTTTTASPKAEEEEPPRDEEGLLLSYDVILCGTGLVQSIVASALTRAGKTVLHCDGNDHYGELDTVWTFDYLQEQLKQQQAKENKPKDGATKTKETSTNQSILLSPLGSCQSLQFHSSGTRTEFPVTEIGAKVQTPYGVGTVKNKHLPTTKEYGSLAMSLSNWTMADGSNPTVYMGVDAEELKKNTDNNSKSDSHDIKMEDYFQKSRTHELKSQKSRLAHQILQQQSRSLALDVNPLLLYASGVAVQGMLTSDVAEHVEFQTMSAVYWLANDSANGKLERVPCSKGDVFQSSLLPSPLDKRRFMKFFQSAMDYATERELQQQEQQTVNAANEAPTDANNNTEEGVLSLNERQLNQGRSLARPQNKAISQKDLQTLYGCIAQNMDFESYLQDHAKLSPQLRQLIRHSLALELGTAANTGDENRALGLSTLEGMSRLCDHLKALGRYGTTAFLTPLYGSGEISQFFCRSAAVYGATYLLRRAPKDVTISLNENKDRQVHGVTLAASDDDFFGPPKEKHVMATHVVIAQEAKLQFTNVYPQRVLRRISVVRGAVIPDASVARSVIIIPPGAILADHKYAIHGLVLDDNTRVAPLGCNVLHLTTVVQGDTRVLDEQIIGILDQAAKVILELAEDADEIYHTMFSYGLPKEDTEAEDNVAGLHVLQRSAMPLVADEAFEKAQSIFRTICGNGEEFLALWMQMQTKLKEQLKEAYRGPNQVDDDNEQIVLDSAMEMLG